jgi:hypothetical protein
MGLSRRYITFLYQLMCTTVSAELVTKNIKTESTQTINILYDNPTSNNQKQTTTADRDTQQSIVAVATLQPTRQPSTTTITERDTQKSTVGQPTGQPTTNNTHRQGHPTIYSGRFTTNPTTSNKQLPAYVAWGAGKTTLSKSRLYPPSQGLRIWLTNCSLSRPSTEYQSLL